MTQDLLSIIDCFSNRLSSLRKHKKRLREQIEEQTPEATSSTTPA
jgi:predicted site-specific integrase-resolvase